MQDFMPLFIGLAAILGLVMGSFLTCAASRAMAHMNWTTEHSVCDYCGHVLGVLDLIPVLSWVFSGGKCRHCKAKLPVSYPLSEIACALGYVTILLWMGPTLYALEGIVIYSILYAIAVCDWTAYTIPNGLVIAGIAVRVVFAVIYAVLGMEDDWLQGLLCGIVMAGAMLVMSLVIGKLKGTSAMGGGDIKLLFMLGLYLSVAECFVLLIVSCLLGIFLGLFPRKGAAHSLEELDERDACLAGEAPAKDADEDARTAVRAAAETTEDAGEAGRTATKMRADAKGVPVKSARADAASAELADEDAALASGNAKASGGPQLIPFGTALAIGFWFTVTLGSKLVSLYLGLF